MNHKKVSAAVLAALAAAATWSAEAADEKSFQPYIGLDLTWVDNLNLAGPGDGPKQEEYIGQVTPGLRLKKDTQRLKTYLDYRMQALFYEENDDLNEVRHNGSLSLDLTAVENWLSVKADGAYFQSLVDPNRPANINNMFAVGNQADTATGRITPTLRHRFGSADFLASYSVGFVDYRDDSDSANVLLDDSRNEEGIAQLSGADPEALVTWLGSYDYQHVEYDLSLPFEYERAYGELGLRVGPGLRLIGRGGEESDPFDLPSDGGLDESFWAAGFDWRRGANFQLRVLGGERFFGNSWEALLRAKGRVLDLELNYEETPTTQTQRISMTDIQPPDPALPVQPVPPDAASFGRSTSDTYLLKRAHMSLAAVGRLTRIGVDVTTEEREYVLLGGIQDQFDSARVFVSRRFGQYTSGEISAGLVDSELREGGDYRDVVYDLRLARQIGQRTSVSLTGHRLSRSGDIDEYDANWVSVGLLMSF